MISDGGSDAQEILDILTSPEAFANAERETDRHVIGSRGPAAKAALGNAPKAALGSQTKVQADVARAMSATDDGDQGDQDAETDGTETADADADDGESRPAPVADTASKLVVRLSKSQRDLDAANKRIRELGDRIRQTEERSQQQTLDLRGDRLEVARRAIAHSMGVKVDDPKVKAELKELMADVMYEELDESVLRGKDLEDMRRTQAERRQRREDQAWRARVEADGRRRDEEQARQMADVGRQNDVAAVHGVLIADAARYPYLMAQDEVGAADIVDAISHALQTGQAQINGPADVRALVAHFAGNFDRHFRGLAKRLAPIAAPKKAAPETAVKETEAKTQQAKKGAGGKGPRGKAVGGAGGGGRGVPKDRDESPDRDEDDEDLISSSTDIVNAMVRQSRGKLRI